MNVAVEYVEKRHSVSPTAPGPKSHDEGVGIHSMLTASSLPSTMPADWPATSVDRHDLETAGKPRR